MDVFDRLHQTLDARPTPEAVASLIREALRFGSGFSRLLPVQDRILRRAAQSPAGGYSSMHDDFERPVAADHKVRTLLALFDKQLPDDVVRRMAEDPWLLHGQLAFLSGFLGWMPGAHPATSRSLNREQRAAIGVDIPRRRYRKLVRQMRRTDRRAWDLKRQVMLRQMVLVGRSGLAYSITVDEMRADPDAAAFVAYWTAQRNRRRQFSLAGRDNPFDQIAEMLFARCQTRGADTDWWMIARVYPVPEVLARLDQDRLGQLMAHWFGFMRLAADRMRDLAAAWPDDFDRSTMVVRRGMDSSTWNTVAQAYNAARAAWINVVDAAGARSVLTAVCPGKAMRLMAGDLAAWHDRQTGSTADPQTRVWASLPAPWDAIDGTVPCTSAMVKRHCHQQGVDPSLSGWIAPAFTGGPAADWKPTPELVHGVEVTDPLWAGLLRRSGVFSGRPLDADGRQVAAGYHRAVQGAGQ